MKLKNAKISLMLLCLCILSVNINLNAQDVQEKKIDERLKHYKEKYEEIYATDFETANNAVKTFLDEKNCQVLNSRAKKNEKGNQRSTLQSDLHVFANGDNVEVIKALQSCTLEPPFLRGGIVWISGRVKYKFIIEEQGDGTVNVVIATEISGFENSISHKSHDFASNGLFEFQAFEAISNIIGSK